MWTDSPTAQLSTLLGWWTHTGCCCHPSSRQHCHHSCGHHDCGNCAGGARRVHCFPCYWTEESVSTKCTKTVMHVRYSLQHMYSFMFFVIVETKDEAILQKRRQHVTWKWPQRVPLGTFHWRGAMIMSTLVPVQTFPFSPTNRPSCSLFKPIPICWITIWLIIVL